MRCAALLSAFALLSCESQAPPPRPPPAPPSDLKVVESADVGLYALRVVEDGKRNVVCYVIHEGVSCVRVPAP